MCVLACSLSPTCAICRHPSARSHRHPLAPSAIIRAVTHLHPPPHPSQIHPCLCRGSNTTHMINVCIVPSPSPACTIPIRSCALSHHTAGSTQGWTHEGYRWADVRNRNYADMYAHAERCVCVHTRARPLAFSRGPPCCLALAALTRSVGGLG